MSVWTFSASVSWKPTVKQGLSYDIGSWKIMVISFPMMRRRAATPIVIMSRPSKNNLSALTLAVHGRRPMTASMATDLPGAELTDNRQHVTLVQREGDIVDGAEQTVRGLELDGEVLDLEQRHAGQLRLNLG